MSTNDNHINYIEFKAKDIIQIKKFSSAAFDWKFTDYGESYVAFEESGIAGGFERSDNEIVKGRWSFFIILTCFR